MTNFEKFLDLGKSFESKITQEYQIDLRFELLDLNTDNIFEIKVKDGKVKISTNELTQVEEIFTMSSSTFERLYDGEISPLTAFANEPNDSGEMVGLINPKIKKKEDLINSAKVSELPENERKKYFRRLHMFDEFFNIHPLSKICIKDKSTRKLHGVKSIGLYHEFDDIKQLAAYFKIEENETLWQQGINKGLFVINGKGILEVDNNKYEIKKYEYYRIRSKTGNGIIIKNKLRKPLELLYM